MLSNIEIKLFDYSEENQHIYGEFLKNDKLSLHHLPFRFILSLINKQLSRKGEVGYFIVGNHYGASEDRDKKILFSLRNIESESFLVKLLKKKFF